MAMPTDRRHSHAERPEPTVWPILHYDDASCALRFLLDAFGFREALVLRDDHSQVIHAELRWPDGGAVVFGSASHTDGVHGEMRPGTGSVYVVADDIDAVYRRAVRANATIVQSLHDTQFGAGIDTRAFTARNPDGNLWTFGTYRGAP
jgi:uncharacterized glyoxalase superfamily protein PhnB